MHRKLSIVAFAAISTAMFSACGGGDESVDNSLSNDIAQGYAADAASMPAASAAGLEAAATALEFGLVSSSSSALAASDDNSESGRARALSASAERVTALATTPVATAACPGGGTVSWTATGPTLVQLLNGQLDAGESYEVTFSACAGTTPGLTLDGRLSLTVNARNNAAADLAFGATALQVSTAQGRVVINGTLLSQRGTTSGASGTTVTTSRLTSPSLAVASAFATRLASYELRNLDWSVTRSRDAVGSLLTTAHQGSLSLSASTTRRPAATLQVVTQGSLSLAADAAVVQGSYSLTTANDKLSVSYGPGTVSIALDLGNNGTLDRNWTISRPAFLGEAG